MSQKLTILLTLILLIVGIKAATIPSTCHTYIEARSAGYVDGNDFIVYINNVKQTVARSRGVNFAVIDQFSGTLIDTKGFDTYGDSNKTTEMIAYVNSIKAGYVVVVGTKDSAEAKMSSSGYSALQKLGMKAGTSFPHRGAYVLIGGKTKKAEGDLLEMNKGQGNGFSIIKKCVEDKVPTNCANYVTAASGGKNDYERFGVYFSHVAQDVSFRGRGHNVMVLDKNDTTIIKDKKKFDTYNSSTKATVIPAYENYLNSISQGDIVIIGTFDEGGDNLTTGIYNQFKTLGASGTISIGHRESFALIGTKGGASGSAVWLKRSIGAGGSMVQKCVESCNFQCTTCFGHKDSCTACTTRSNINPSPSCLCKDTFYENSSQTCSACLKRCAKCVNPNECTACGNGLGRATTGNMCVCQNGYYEKSGDNLDCGQCQYPCQNCTGSATNCTSCATSVNRNQDSSCQCESTSFDNGSDCISCTYPCQTCNSSTSCKTCQTTANRVSVTDCSCKATYYENGSACIKCPYPCVNCSSATQCTSCVVDSNRSNSHPCGCNSGYFDNGTNCQKCHYKCTECTDYNTCKANSCSDSTRDAADGCNCKPGKFDSGVAKCQECSYKCATCSLSADNCDSCATGTGRSVTTPQCGCSSTYFDDGNDNVNCVKCVHPCVNCSSLTSCDSCVVRDNIDSKPSCKCTESYFEKTDKTCAACQHPCKNCETSNSNCTECVSTVNRQSFPSCLCTPGFFDNGSDLDCKPCQHPCTKCTGTGLNQCTECVVRDNANASPNCQCKDGYYEDSNKLCVKCPNKFAKCSSPTVGIECAVGTGRSTSLPCDCQDTYFDDGSNSANCVKCSHPCVNCQSSTFCDSCVVRDFSNSINTCTCQDGYYEKTDLTCAQCTHPCSKCETSNTNCIECVSTVNRQNYPSCLCQDGYFDNGIDMGCQQCEHPCTKCTGIAQNQCTECVVRDNANPSPNCQCKDGYYEDSNKLCVKCPGRFAKCSDENTGTECAAGLGRSAVKPDCKCESGYFDDGSNSAACVQCIHPCQSCSSLTVCDICLSRNNINAAPDCHCKTGYYEDSSSLACNICVHPCQTCINSASQCESCVSGSNRNAKPDCGCKDGFYEDENLVCQPCVYPCLKCSSQNVCIDCQTTSNRNLPPLDNSTCDCQDGYYDDGSNCEQCDMQCSTCVGSSENCVDCSEITRHGGLCICRDGLYDVGVPKCEQCDYKCGTCINQADNCISCSNDNRDINNDCKCKDGYYEDNNKQCQSCVFPCQYCTSQLKCITCHQTGIEAQDNLRQAPGCTCAYGYYEDQETQLCEKCHSRCNSCTLSAQNCTDCKIQQGRNAETPDCTCKQNGYFATTDLQTNNEICSPCFTGCRICENSDTCIECNNKNALPSSKCQQVVPQQGSYMSFSVNINGQNVVQNEVCQIQCQGCEESVNNCIECTTGVQRTMQAPQCGCNIRYYEVSYTVDCQQCMQHCKDCKNEQLCLECLPGLNRTVNKISGQCECALNFKEFQGECVKCYAYQHDCLIQCPSSTIQDENLFVCIDTQVSYQSNVQLLIKVVLGVLIFMVIGKILILKFISKNIKHISQQNTNQKSSKNASGNSIQQDEEQYKKIEEQSEINILN